MLAVFWLSPAPQLALLRSALVPSQALRTTTAILESCHYRQRVTWNFKVINLADLVQHRLEGDALIVSLMPEEVKDLLRIDGHLFAGAGLEIVRGKNGKASEEKSEPSNPNTLDILKEVVLERYDGKQKLLDLSGLEHDQTLSHLRKIDDEYKSHPEKVFPALMIACDQLWETIQQKADCIIGVSLANNKISSVESITMLAETFPAIRNLDLSENLLEDIGALLPLRLKLRSLEQLILIGNPIVSVPGYGAEIVKKFSTLLMLDNHAVPGAEVAAPIAAPVPPRRHQPLPGVLGNILVGFFQDQANIGENFVKNFFRGYDEDRSACINAFYDSKSTFSLSINTSARRASNSPGAGWDDLISKSRNLIRVTQLPAKLSRLYTGASSILNAWLRLPATRHPSLELELDKWCIECSSVPNLPDPVNNSMSGVNGLIIVVHGQFNEVDSLENKLLTRSFDRTFILGPGGGDSGVRVACDTLILRNYGGSDAWRPQVGDYVVAHPAQPEMKLQPLIPHGFGLPQEGKSTEQLQREGMAIELSKATKMNLRYCGECLQANGWSLEAAVVAFFEMKEKVPFWVDLLLWLSWCFAS